MKRIILTSTLSAGIASAIVSGSAFAVPDYILDIGTPGTPSAANEGSVSVGLSGYGGFGSNDFDGRTIGSADLTTATQNEATTRTSFIAARFGPNPNAGQLPGAAQYIGSGLGVETNNGDFFNAPTPNNSFTEISAGSDRVETTFSSVDLANLDFRLIQTTNRFGTDPGDPSAQGSFLQQDYEITNNTGADISGELLRYAAFALEFLSPSPTTGAGRVIRNGQDYLFATQDVVGDMTETVYTAIGAEILGTTNPTTNRFEIGEDFNTDEHVLDTSINGPLTDAVANNGGSGERATTPSFYGLAFRNSFSIADGETITYRTTTYWGIGSIDNFNPITNGGGGNPTPSPGTLALMGMAGLWLGRLRKKSMA